MPIDTTFEFKRLDEQEFRELDYLVMGVAYEIQNELGRLFDEKVYHQELMSRLSGKVDCRSEEPIALIHKSFSKILKMDFVVECGLICELKAVERLAPVHESQLIEYMLLCNASRGKAINFGSPSVQGKLISSDLTHELRRRITWIDKDYIDLGNESENFRSLLLELLEDWGANLRLETYYDALNYLLGGAHQVIRTIDVQTKSNQVVHQKVHLLNPATAFKISAITKNTAGFKTQLQKFLDHSHLRFIQWVNLDHQEISFTTISKKKN